MKKFTSILAAATFVVALSSCGSKTAETTEMPAADTTTIVTETPMVDSTTIVSTVDSANMTVDTIKH